MKYQGKSIVWALHPAQPSDFGGSRGRKRHLADNPEAKLTLCNMLNDGLFEKYEVNNGMCKNCIKELRKRQLLTKDK